ncbi:MAG: Fic family protein [Zoogloeaceae bacterium]|nr:Fic family protein [Zoogloeaceae bacterium]
MTYADPYIDPRTGIFYNKLGICNNEALSKAEFILSYQRAAQLEIHPVPGNFDMAHLRAIHKMLFQDVYPWAGELRTVEISKGQTQFCYVQMLEYGMNDIHKRLEKDNYLRNLGEIPFIEKSADFFGDVNALHPFREGNGRAIRIFIRQLAKQAGYDLNLKTLAQDPDVWNYASALTTFRKMDAMNYLFETAIHTIPTPASQKQ